MICAIIFIKNATPTKNEKTFTNGILEEIFEFFQIKVSAFRSNLDKHCMLVLDEMFITLSRTFDISTNSFVTTLCNNNNNNNNINIM